MSASSDPTRRTGLDDASRKDLDPTNEATDAAEPDGPSPADAPVANTEKGLRPDPDDAHPGKTTDRAQ